MEWLERRATNEERESKCSRVSKELDSGSALRLHPTHGKGNSKVMKRARLMMTEKGIGVWILNFDFDSDG